MRTTLLAGAAALALVPTWAAAEPLRLTDAQLGEVAAGVIFEALVFNEIGSFVEALAEVSGNSAIAYGEANADGENTFTEVLANTQTTDFSSLAQVFSVSAADGEVD